MSGNPAPNTPLPTQPNTYPAYQRWWWRHVLHRLPQPKRSRILSYAKASLTYAGKMHYTEGLQRSELFHRKPGRFGGARADCSQYSASLAHWAGVRDVTDKDWTGTLANKGVVLTAPEPGCFVFFGQPPFVHMAVVSSKFRCIGFGRQGAPDDNTIAGLLAYFAGNGHPGHAFRDLTR